MDPRSGSFVRRFKRNFCSPPGNYFKMVRISVEKSCLANSNFYASVTAVFVTRAGLVACRRLDESALLVRRGTI